MFSPGHSCVQLTLPIHFSQEISMRPILEYLLLPVTFPVQTEKAHGTRIPANRTLMLTWLALASSYFSQTPTHNRKGHSTICAHLFPMSLPFQFLSRDSCIVMRWQPTNQ